MELETVVRELQTQVAQLEDRFSSLERRLTASSATSSQSVAAGGPDLAAPPGAMPPQQPPPPAYGQKPFQQPGPGQAPPQQQSAAPGQTPPFQQMPPPLGGQPHIGASTPGPHAAAGVSRPTTVFNFEVFLKWAGLTLVVLAAIFFVGTAISRGWIGPELQLAGATLAGLGLYAVAFRIRRERRPWAITLAIGGAIVVPICAAASSEGLDLFSSGVALALLAVATALAFWVAFQLQAEALVPVAVVVGIANMLWINSTIDELGVPIASLTVLAVAATSLTLVMRWTLARILSTWLILFTFVLFGVAYQDEAATTTERAVAAIAFGLVVAAAWLAPVADSRRMPKTSSHEDGLYRIAGQINWPAVDARLTLLVPLTSLLGHALILDLDDTSTGYLGLALAGAFIVLALTAQPFTGATVMLSTAAGAVGVAAWAAVLLLEGPGLLAALAALAVVAGVVAWLTKDIFFWVVTGILGIIVGPWAVGSMLSAALGLETGFGVGQHLANGFVAALLIALAGGSVVGADRDERLRSASPLVVIVAWTVGFIYIASIFAEVPQGQVAISIIWATAACTAIVLGVVKDNAFARVLGLVSLGVVLVKLFTVDLAAVDTLWRVALFSVIGLGLLRLGYVLPKLTPTAERPPTDGPRQEQTPV